ncbi:hypothetical protein [Phocaeicola oris]|uniref:hypothetical protein n=1 Tax=Phocaeicola oris TaxID=2896850 RepID=UPI00234EF88A|nr:hypothetical protein [Phocaeicola oris]MCE2615318.1 hypothetical protein [Phocaeicola oris]
MSNEKKKKAGCTFIFILLHLVITRFYVRIVDAMVHIDDDIALLIISVLILNAVLFLFFRMIYRKMFK